MIQLFNTLLYQPIFNLLVFIYNIIPGHDIGVAIILLTVIIKLALYPFSLQSIKAQKSMRDLQPKIDELKKKLKGQKDVLAREMMQLYKREKINPMSSCLPLLIQFPFLIAVYRVFRAGLGEGSLDMLYSFIDNPGTLNQLLLAFLIYQNPRRFWRFWLARLNIGKPR